MFLIPFFMSWRLVQHFRCSEVSLSLYIHFTGAMSTYWLDTLLKRGGGVKKPVSIWCNHYLPHAVQHISSRRVDGVVDGCLWSVLVHSASVAEAAGCWQELEHSVKHAASQTCSMGDVSGEHAAHAGSGMFPASRNCAQALVELGHGLSCCNVRRWRWMNERLRWASLRRLLTVCAEILWFDENAACGGPELVLVTCGLLLWARLDVLPNSPKCVWRQLMVEKMNIQFKGNSSGGQFCQLYPPSKPATPVALCCVIIGIKCPFIMSSLRLTCAVIMLSLHYVDMADLWCGWIIWYWLIQICEQLKKKGRLSTQKKSSAQTRIKNKSVFCWTQNSKYLNEINEQTWNI